MQRHQLSRILEDLPTEAYDAMRADIAHNGFMNAEIFIYQGQILEGWHQYSIAEELGRVGHLAFLGLTDWGIDAVLRACSQHLFRRHLSASQRAQIAVELCGWIGPGGDRKNEDFKQSNDHLTTQAMAVNAGVSEKSIRRAKTVKRKGLEETVIAGEKTANQVINQGMAKNTPKQSEVLADDLHRDEGYPTIVIDLSSETLESLGEIGPPLIEGAFVFIWAREKNVPDPFKLLEDWGLTYCFIMDGHKEENSKDQSLNQCDDAFTLIGAKGSFSLATANKFEVAFQAERDKHSLKLDRFYDLIRRLTREPRLLMLSPKSIDGFQT